MLTPRLLDLFRYIEQYVADTGGFPPSQREMAAGIGVASTSGINRMLDELEERGFVRRIKGRARCIEITAPRCPHCHKRSTDPVREAA
jgi:SOS-response transcriptional repressor LexA